MPASSNQGHPRSLNLKTLGAILRRLGASSADEAAGIARQAWAQDQLDREHQLEREGRSERRQRQIPRALATGIARVNKLRRAAAPESGAKALKDLDSACLFKLGEWEYMSRNFPNRPPPSSPSPGLTLGQSLVIGALCALVFDARYPAQVDGVLGDVAHLLSRPRPQLAGLGITGALAALVGALATRPEWQGGVRRCLYQFSPKSGEYGKGCLLYFLDRSQGKKATRGCCPSHTASIHKYERKGVSLKTRPDFTR